ncbi:MAG: Gfo/Idh/MocA family oxidoreductase [Rhodoglobus sp.]|nr:Gfo/Idh/MocA family oxidoreductase [Rhodoglobus sp.]
MTMRVDDGAGERPLTVGVIGAGGNTRLQHIPKLQSIPGVEVVAVRNRSDDSTRRVAEEFGIPQSASSWMELVDDPDIDAIVIGTWPDMHARLAIAALRAGKHVLCEARLARSVAEARAMVAAAQENPGLVAQVVPAPFTLPLDATVSRLIGEGYLGPVHAIEISERGGLADATAPRTWRQTTHISGVNVMSLGIGYESVMRWVGPATRVMAIGRTVIPQRTSSDGMLEIADVPDHLDVIGEMASGAQLSIHLSHVSGFGPENAIHVYGLDGTLKIADGVLWGARRGDDALSRISIPPHEAIGWGVEEEFIGSIRGTEAVRRTTFEDGLRYMLFTEAVWRSIHENRAVALSEL